MTSRTLLLLMLLLPLHASAEGLMEGIAGVVVEGNELRARISPPGGIGADLTLTFEQVVGLTAAAGETLRFSLGLQTHLGMGLS